jgi:hypothetical protein
MAVRRMTTPAASARRPRRPTLAGVQTTATFRLFGNATLTAAAVTRRLAIPPTRALEAGDPVSSRSARTRDSSAWLLNSSPGPEDGTELTEHLHQRQPANLRSSPTTQITIYCWSTRRAVPAAPAGPAFTRSR